MKITIFLPMRKKILTFSQREKTSTGVSWPSSSQKQEGIGEGEEDV
jgi:hypothetical protein